MALAQVLPFTNITDLELYNNKITDIGAQALADVYPSTRLNRLLLYGNNISSSLLAQIESFQWQQYCQDQLCHANAQYNNYTATLTSKDSASTRRRPSYRGRNHMKMNRRYNVFDRNVKRDKSKKKTLDATNPIEIIDKDVHQATTTDTDIHLTHSESINSADTFSNLVSPALPASTSSESAASLLAFTTAGAVMSLLLYKNVIVVRTIVNAGCRLLGSFLYKTYDSLKTATNFYSFHSTTPKAEERKPYSTPSEMWIPKSLSNS